MPIKKDLFFAENGMLRIRWWPLIPVVGYIGLNVLTFAMVMMGAKGAADPFWHAPIIWVFGG